MITLTTKSMEARGLPIHTVEMIAGGIDSLSARINFFLHFTAGKIEATSDRLNQMQHEWLSGQVGAINAAITAGETVDLAEIFKGWQPIFRQEWEVANHQYR